MIYGNLKGTNHYFFTPLGKVNNMKAELFFCLRESHKHKEVLQQGA